MADSDPTPRFDTADFAVLERLAESETVDEDVDRAARDSWNRCRALVRAAARQADARGLEIELWPWKSGGEVFPFVWTRCKRPDRSAFAAHVGLFLSPGHCNFAVDLEKDLLDAGTSRECLEDVLVFYRQHAPAVLAALGDSRLRVWTDPDNVLEIDAFLAHDLDAFLEAGHDPGHPWPKVGYLLQRSELEAHPEGQVRDLAGRMRRLIPVYDALIASCEA